MKSDQDSGFRWGPFELHDQEQFKGRRPLYIEQKGGCVHYPYAVDPNNKRSHHISEVDTSKPIIHKGNHFGHFTHFRDYPEDCEVYFWDNCLLPQLMYRNEANPAGDKNWTRIVYRSTMPGWVHSTEDRLQWHEDRVNARLQKDSRGQIQSWRDIIRIETRQTEGDRVLLALPSDNALLHWYGVSRSTIIEKTQAVCDRWGWQLVIRDKPQRRDRENGGSIQDQLRADRYRCMVTVNSASAIEALCLGVPVVALGAHSLGTQAMTWELFEKNWFCPPVVEWVDLRIRQLLCLTWHKDELLDGTWALSPETGNTEPFNQWEINL